MKIILIIFFAVSNLAISQVRYEIPVKSELISLSRNICESQVGIKELTGHNDGKDIQKYETPFGLKFQPYCMMGQYWCYQNASIQLGLENPMPKTPLANGIIEYCKKKFKQVKSINMNDAFIVWKQKIGFNGHIARVHKIGQGGWVETIEFNTSSGNSGNQRDGGGVYERQRNLLHPLGQMFISGFVGVKKI